MASTNIICFGQQPNGFFPKGFFVDKILTARELQRQIGGKIVWFCHDSDHDYRETVTKIKTDRYPGGFVRLNINQPSKFEKLFTPLYLKSIKPGWQEEAGNKLQSIIPQEAHKTFASMQAATVADFCIAMYRALGRLEGIEVLRSSDPSFRKKALDISNQDHYIDIEYKGVLVHARKSERGYFLNHGGNVHEYIPANSKPITQKLFSPTRETRFAWMQSVIHCTHYIYGKGEKGYVDFTPWKDVTFVPRKEIYDSEFAVIDPSASSG